MSADQAALLGAQGELTTAQEDKLRFEADLRVISQQLEHNARQLSILLDEQLSDKERIGRLESEKKKATKSYSA